jgi:hypothetical protein
MIAPGPCDDDNVGERPIAKNVNDNTTLFSLMMLDPGADGELLVAW